MFQMLSNVQSGEAIGLQECVDNRDGGLRVGLRSITYTVGWYNIQDGESIDWRAENEDLQEDSRPSYSFEPGLYNITQFKRIVNRLGVNISFTLENRTGLIKLVLPRGWLVKFTDGLLDLMGLDDGLNGQWLEGGTYDGDRPADFTIPKALHIHLDQISTTKNKWNGMPSKLLCIVPDISNNTSNWMPPRFGDSRTVRFPYPELKQLEAGVINELKVGVRDDRGRVLNNHGQSISVVLEIQ